MQHPGLERDAKWGQFFTIFTIAALGVGTCAVYRHQKGLDRDQQNPANVAGAPAPTNKPAAP